MRLIESITEMREVIFKAKKTNQRIGFVPTMGFLHEGHISLIKRASEENEFVVMSIFVNPTQFVGQEDYDIYPRNLDRDLDLSREAGVDSIFYPSVTEMYPKGYKTYVDVKDITQKLCGASRPGHFTGVTTIVSKLFNIITPDKAYFGEKDAQQVTVIKQMVRDLNMNIDIVPCPIVREEDGLAMSSRNSYLSMEDRKAAAVLFESLHKAEIMIKNGEKNVQKVKKFIMHTIEKEPKANIDYVEIMDPENLEELEGIQKDTLIAIAVKIGKVRLIDNIRISVF